MTFRDIRWVALALGAMGFWGLYWHWYEWRWQDRIVVAWACGYLILKWYLDISREFEKAVKKANLER